MKYFDLKYFDLPGSLLGVAGVHDQGFASRLVRRRRFGRWLRTLGFFLGIFATASLAMGGALILSALLSPATQDATHAGHVGNQDPYLDLYARGPGSAR